MSKPGYKVNDTRGQRRDEEGRESRDYLNSKTPMLEMDSAPVAAMQRSDTNEHTQEQLMKMVAARFRPGPKRFLIVEDFPIKKVGSIHVPGTSQKPSTSGRVCSIGKDVEGVKIGDHVVYAIFAGTLLPLSREERVRTLQESEIMAWVNDDAPAKLQLEGEVE